MGDSEARSGEKHSFKDVLNALKQDPVTVYVCLVLTLTGAMHGYDNGCGSDLNVNHGFRTAMGWEESLAAQDTTTIFSWYNNTYFIAAAISGFFAGQISDYFGRKKTCILGGAIFALGGLIQSLAGILGNNALIPIFIGRAIVGVSVGALSCVGPMYSSEVATPKIRGFMTSFYQINLNFFLLLGAILGYCTRDSSEGWRYILGLQVTLGLLLSIGISLVPESPKWLLTHKKYDETKAVLKRLRKDTHVDEEFNELLEEFEFEKKRSGTNGSQYTWKESWTSPTVKYTMFIGVLVMFLQIFIAAINVLAFNFPTMLEKMGLLYDEQLLYDIYVKAAFLLGVIFEVGIVDIAGRRTLLLWGMAFMAIFLTIPGAILFVYDGDLSNELALGKLVVAFVGLYQFTFGLTWGPLAWLYCSEIFNPQLRGKGQGVTTSSNWIFNFIQTLFLPALLGWNSGGPLIVFGVACFIIGIPATFFLIPETRGVHLENMDLLFDAKAHGGFNKMICNNIKKELPQQATVAPIQPKV